MSIIEVAYGKLKWILESFFSSNIVRFPASVAFLLGVGLMVLWLLLDSGGVSG